jgi:protein TonB
MRPETVSPGEYVPAREPVPELVIPRIEQAAAAAISAPAASLDVAGGSTGAEQVSEAPALRLHDGRLATLIGACYPAASRRMGEEGRAIVHIAIDAAGRARRWSLAQGTGFPRLDSAVGCVIRRLEFHPARLDGNAVAAEARLPIAFQLD